MLSLCLFTIFAVLAGYAAAGSHQVTVRLSNPAYCVYIKLIFLFEYAPVTSQMTSKCSSGSPVLLYEANSTPQGPATIEGQLLGGIAWLDGFAGANCQSSGVNCGVVEFTLRNDAPYQNSADLSFQPQGNHQ